MHSFHFFIVKQSAPDESGQDLPTTPRHQSFTKSSKITSQNDNIYALMRLTPRLHLATKMIHFGFVLFTKIEQAGVALA
jgi:hypothetical protein